MRLEQITVGSKDKLLLQMSGGHIGMIVGSGASRRVWPQIEAWLEKRSGEATPR